jgi:6-phosphogluconate dehydrogenase (decarboxylating)
VRFGIVGLGRMGANLSRQAIDGGHEVVGWFLDVGTSGGVSGAGACFMAATAFAAGESRSTPTVVIPCIEGRAASQMGTARLRRRQRRF